MHQGHQLGMLLRRAYLPFHRRANARLLKHGVTADQFVLLSVLASEDGITQMDIVERMASDPNTVTATVRLLEGRRLIRRVAHARDRRARCVFLTNHGRRVQQRAANEAELVLATLWDCMPEQEQSQIEQFLVRIHSVFAAPTSKANGAPASRPVKSRKAAQRTSAK